MSIAISETCRDQKLLAVPCHVGDPDLWFAEDHGPVAVGELDSRRLVETGAL